MSTYTGKGTLYLIPTPLGEVTPTEVMAVEAYTKVTIVKYFIVEQLRTARRLLKSIDKSLDLDTLTFFELNKFTDPVQIESFLKPALEGADIALLSEAGSPCVADPGAVVVGHAHRLGIRVSPLSGPSSIIQSLMASGFNGQSFTFHGYPPIAAEERVRWIKNIEKDSFSKNQTQIFIETPFRNNSLLETLLKYCQPGTKLCVASNISTAQEWIFSSDVSDWKNKQPDLHKKPAVFLLWRPS
ncbi:MAG: SAM-dependent methyltransferase [Bacteroidales bacterium]|nr:SAM-dependent methyltransferase [Bacteroidales bacterium]